jgi:hypothetical protein
MASQIDRIVSTLPCDAVTESVRRSTHALIEVCRRETAGQHLYGFIWGANDDITCVAWRAQTEELLTASRETASRANRVQPDRFDPFCWRVSNDLPIRIPEGEFDPGPEINAVWAQLQSHDLDEDTLFDAFEVVQERVFDAIIRGLKQFDAEYSWEGIDRSRFFLSAFIFDGPPKMNLLAARELNSAEVFAEFQQSYAPSSLDDEDYEEEDEDE